MSSTRTLPQRKAGTVHGFKALAEDGTFEAIVAVFGNIDLGNDRIVAGAFADSLARWKDSGDPIPVIFSHRWDDLDAHVGYVIDAEELHPGDARLPAAIADLGGLYVKARMEVTEDFAGRLWKRLKARTIREFSFAYDVVKARPGADGALELRELDLIEVGPTLKGMNPLTALIGAKNRTADDALDALTLADELAASLGAGIAKTATDAAGAHLPAPPTKRLVVDELPGSVESTLGAIEDAAEAWAMGELGDTYYDAHLEATFLDEGRAIVTAERMMDPIGEGPLYELTFTFDATGVVITDAVPAELTATVEAIATQGAAARLASVRRGAAKLAAKTESPAPPADSATVPTVKADEAEDANEDSGAVERTLAEAEALTIGIDL